MLFGDISLYRCDLPVLRGPNSHKLKLFSTSGTILNNSNHFSLSVNLSGSIPIERNKTSIHSSFVKFALLALYSFISTRGIWIGFNFKILIGFSYSN